MNEEGRRIMEICDRNLLDILNGKYGEDVKDELTFINHTGRSVPD